MKTLYAIIIIVAVACLVAFPIFAYLGFNSPLPFATWGTTLYNALSTKVSTSISTVYGLVGTTGAGLAGTAALAYALKQKSKVEAWLKGQVATKDTTISNLTGQTESLTSATKLKDEAFTKLDTVNKEVTSKYGELQGQYQTLQGQLKTQSDQAQALVNKNATLINDQIKNKLPENTIFTNPANPNEKLLVVKEKYIT